MSSLCLVTSFLRAVNALHNKQKANLHGVEPGTHLVHGQVDASVRNDAQGVRQVASVEGPHPLRLQDLPGAVGHPWVLSCLPQRQTGFQHLSEVEERRGQSFGQQWRYFSPLSLLMFNIWNILFMFTTKAKVPLVPHPHLFIMSETNRLLASKHIYWGHNWMFGKTPKVQNENLVKDSLADCRLLRLGLEGEKRTGCPGTAEGTTRTRGDLANALASTSCQSLGPFFNLEASLLPTTLSDYRWPPPSVYSREYRTTVDGHGQGCLAEG